MLFQRQLDCMMPSDAYNISQYQQLMEFKIHPIKLRMSTSPVNCDLLAAIRREFMTVKKRVALMKS